MASTSAAGNGPDDDPGSEDDGARSNGVLRRHNHLHLFRDHGQFFTAYDLMRWYMNTEKMSKVQDHAWGLQDHKNASAERLRVNNKRGHQD